MQLYPIKLAWSGWSVTVHLRTEEDRAALWLAQRGQLGMPEVLLEILHEIEVEAMDVLATTGLNLEDVQLIQHRQGEAIVLLRFGHLHSEGRTTLLNIQHLGQSLAARYSETR